MATTIYACSSCAMRTAWDLKRNGTFAHVMHRPNGSAMRADWGKCVCSAPATDRVYVRTA